MIREDRFLISRKPYAVDLGSLHPWASNTPGEGGWYEVAAVWFRRKQGVTVACVGNLHTVMRTEPADVTDFLARFTDGRHGGHCEGRWDGENYWGAQRPEEIERHLELLRPMLANYPAVPPGFDGWYRF